MELMSCPNLAVPSEVMHHVVRVESSYNPYAIGVVGGRLARQPKSVAEALSTVRMLESKGYNFSVGLAQVNRYNLTKYGLDSYEQAFQACPNLQAGSRILAECYGRSSGNWGKSFSCYYSGNFVTGFRHGYVQKVYASIRGGATEKGAVPAIEVIGKPGRRQVAVTRHPGKAGDVLTQRVNGMQAASTLVRAQVLNTDSVAVAPAVATSLVPTPPAPKATGLAAGIDGAVPLDRAFVF